jgi:hypothetical protein
MKRSGGSQQSAEAARQAADKLRDATNLLGGTQQQLASGKVNSLSHEAERLTQEERAQADRIDKLAAGQQGDSGTMDRDSMMARLAERNRLAGERQQLSNDLSKLQKGVRDAAREMASNQPGVAQKLRDALTEMDQSDLDNHVQRTADWLRGGVNPNSNGTENQIAQGLQKLSQQLRQAQQGIGQGKSGQRGTAQGDETAALSQVERLRSQLEAMASSRSGNGQQQGQNGRSGQQGRGGQQGQNNQLGQNGNQRGQAGSNGQQAGNNGQRSSTGEQMGQNAQGGGSSQPGGFGQQAGGDRTGQRDAQSGDVRYGGGGGADGTVWGNINTGNNRYREGGPRPTPLDASGNPADTERTYQQGVRELNQLRQMVQGDPQAAKEVQELARQMQQLDPSRFPGNPAMVEQMHREVLSSIDRIELQLQRNGSTEARTGKPYAVPAGYQDSVAEYYRRLSKNP